MCLSRITKKLKEPKTMQFYKIMWRLRRKGKPNLYFFQFRDLCEPIEKGKVKHASVGDIEIDHDHWRSFVSRRKTYRAGFHGYTNLRRAARRVRFDIRSRRWQFKKTARGNLFRVLVLCEGPVRTIGSQGDARVTVADTMKILREVPLTKLFPNKK